jgi:S1-C subfamily serine protease
VRTGDEVYATGHPFGLADSFSSGVVSGLNRTVPINDQQTLKGLIQFDAAVNPGNSGGPLLNKAGQVVGIVTALANPAGENFFVGIGFAIPIATAGGAAGAPQQ